MVNCAFKHQFNGSNGPNTDASLAQHWHLLHQVTLWNLLHIDGLTNVDVAEVWHESGRYDLTPAEQGWICERGGSSLLTLTSCSSDTGLSLDEVPSCLTYSLTWRRRAIMCLRRLLRDSRGVQGSKVKPGCAGLNQAGDLLRSSCVCVRHAVFSSCDAMKRKATEHFAHVRIIVKSWKLWNNTCRSLGMMSKLLIFELHMNKNYVLLGAYCITSHLFRT